MELVFKMKNKRGQVRTVQVERGSRWWLWILVVLVVITVGVGAWFLLSGDGGSVFGGGIPSPPALPS